MARWAGTVWEGGIGGMLEKAVKAKMVANLITVDRIILLLVFNLTRDVLFILFAYALIPSIVQLV